MNHLEFAARQKTVMLEGIAHCPVRIAYTDIGQGAPIILMHGIPTWSFLYHAVIEELAKTHRVIAPDFIGHGHSDQRDMFDRSLLAQRAMILSLIDHLGLARATLIGHDTGGGVALIMGVENQNRVERLVLSNIVAYDSWPIDDMINVGHPKFKTKSNDEIREFLIGGFNDGLSRKERLTPEFVEGIIAPYITDEGKLSLIRNASGLNTSHTMMIAHRHHQISAPTLLVWGVDDPWQPISDGERLAAEIPTAKLIPVRNASHWIPQDAPEEWLAHIQAFLLLQRT